MKVQMFAKAAAAAALITLGQVAVVQPAMAATSINTQVTFLPGVTTLPGYTTARVVQPFTGANNSAPAAIAGYTQSLSNALVQNNPAQTGLTGGYLEIKPTNSQAASYTLAIAGPTPALHFISVLLSNFAGSTVNSLTVQYEDNSISGNLLVGIATGANGQLIINQAGSSNGIRSLVFSAAAGTGNRSLLIDNIALAAPEPATWAMMLLGFGLVGSQLRRRKVRVRFATA